MRIDINGEAREISAGLMVLGLLEHLGLKAMGTVVERNGQIVEREAFGATALCEGDRLEIVRLVGGG